MELAGQVTWIPACWKRCRTYNELLDTKRRNWTMSRDQGNPELPPPERIPGFGTPSATPAASAAGSAASMAASRFRLHRRFHRRRVRLRFRRTLLLKPRTHFLFVRMVACVCMKNSTLVFSMTTTVFCVCWPCCGKLASWDSGVWASLP